MSSSTYSAFAFCVLNTFLLPGFLCHLRGSFKHDSDPCSPFHLVSGLSHPLVHALTIPCSLSILCFAWGAVAACMAAVQSWNQLAGVRFCLGVAEAGFAPGIAFYLSSWYKRHELAKRYSIYYTATAVSVSHEFHDLYISY
jgi:MFS family permease